MKPDLHYNLFKYFLHASVPPSRTRWWISCVLTLLKQFFSGSGSVTQRHSAEAIFHLSAGSAACPAVCPLADWEENAVRLCGRRPGAQ